MSNMIHETLPTASVALMHYVLAELEPDEPDQLYGNTGLPAAVDFPVHDVIVSVTPVTAPMFDQALLRCAAARRRDVMLIRHGFHPETIDPVRVDVVLRSVGGFASHCSQLRRNLTQTGVRESFGDALFEKLNGPHNHVGLQTAKAFGHG